MQLKEHKASTKDEFDKEKETYLQTLLAAKQAEALALYVKRLREAAKAEQDGLEARAHRLPRDAQAAEGGRQAGEDLRRRRSRAAGARW